MHVTVGETEAQRVWVICQVGNWESWFVNLDYVGSEAHILNFSFYYFIIVL